MSKEIYMSNKEKKLLEYDIESEKMGQILMEHGAKIQKNAHDKMWDTIKEIWPNAVKFHHPEKGKWSVIVVEPETK